MVDESLSKFTSVIDTMSASQLEENKDFTAALDVETMRKSNKTEIKWATGVLTVAERFDQLLPQTLNALKNGGFDKPRLFVDGECLIPHNLLEYECTQRIPRVGADANWFLAAQELYTREPCADFYGIFEDDFIMSKNVRQYIEACPYPGKAYLNLYLWPCYEKNKGGWYESDQRGKGAVALVFNNDALRTLIQAPRIYKRFADNAISYRPRNDAREHSRFDGTIQMSMTDAGYKEWVHKPSLVQHMGEVSVMGNHKHPQSKSFFGVGFDCMEFLKT